MNIRADYADVYRMLGLSEVAAKIALGHLPMPGPTLRVPFPAVAFPPALIPIWLRPVDLQYFGYWKHFFSKRHVSIVSCAAADGWRPTEVARTIDQFFAYECVHQLCAFGGPTDELRAFAAAAHIDLDALDRLSNEVGENPQALFRSQLFSGGVPLSAAGADAGGYRGDFPHEAMVMTAATLRRTCTLEFTPAHAARIADIADTPPWFSTADQPATFDALLAAGDFAGAWMSLNSSGWQFLQAKQAMRTLSAAAGDADLEILAAAWCGQPHVMTWRY